VNDLLTRLWRLGKPLQWRFLWLMHAKFICGIAREVREETGLTIKAGRLLKVRSGFHYRIEIYYEAVLVDGLDGLTLDPKEVLEARLFDPSDLPDGMSEAHRELAGSL
jgi:8-oxo-dGTP diphosphatase